MSMTMDDSIKRWTAKRKAALVIGIIQGKTTVAEASRSFDLSPLRLRVELMTRSGGWRTRCGPTRSTSGSNTRSS